MLPQLLDIDRGECECILAMSRKDITAVRILTLLKVGVPVDGAGIGSTRAGKFKRNIMYIETKTIGESLMAMNADTYVRTVR